MHFLRMLLGDMLHQIRESSQRRISRMQETGVSTRKRGKDFPKQFRKRGSGMTAVQQFHSGQPRLVSEDGGFDHSEKNLYSYGKVWKLINDRKHRK